jgi:hypothetical protein
MSGPVVFFSLLMLAGLDAVPSGPAPGSQF